MNGDSFRIYTTSDVWKFSHNCTARALRREWFQRIFQTLPWLQSVIMLELSYDYYEIPFARFQSTTHNEVFFSKTKSILRNYYKASIKLKSLVDVKCCVLQLLIIVPYFFITITIFFPFFNACYCISNYLSVRIFFCIIFHCNFVLY